MGRPYVASGPQTVIDNRNKEVRFTPESGRSYRGFLLAKMTA